MVGCAVVNATANLSITPLAVMNGFAPRSSTTRNGLLLDSPETLVYQSASSLQETFTFLLLTKEVAVALAPPAKAKKA